MTKCGQSWCPGRQWWQRIEDEVAALHDLDKADYVAWYEASVLGAGRRRFQCGGCECEG